MPPERRPCTCEDCRAGVISAEEALIKAARDWRIFGVDHNRPKNRHEQALADAIEALSEAERAWDPQGVWATE